MASSRFNRRVLLIASGALGAAGVAAAWMGGVFSRSGGSSARALTNDEKKTLAAVQARLLPSGDGPGAPEVRAADFLEAQLLDPAVRPINAVWARRGVPKLDAWARGRGAADFVSLSAESQDAAIRAYQATAEGAGFVRLMLVFTLEAFLGDPVRGANPGEIGWTWAKHQAGWPRPPSKGWLPKERS